MNLVRSLSLASISALTFLAACGDRPAAWSAGTGGARAFGLEGAVVVVDPPANRAVALEAGADGDPLAVVTTRLPLGHDIVATQVGADGRHLYVLSAGHRAALGDPRPDEAPRLTIIDGGAHPTAARDIVLDTLSDPLDGLTVDPTGRWAVLYAASGAGQAFVRNPNELVVVDLRPTGADAPTTVSLHSFGGHPERLIFAPPLTLPSGLAHLLIVQSAQDLALVTLDDLTRPEITVRLTDAATLARPRPVEIVIDDGDVARNDDARIGVRFEGQTSVMTLQLAPASGPNGYAPAINVADVGGVPTAIAFVRTDGGLRLAALVPARSRAVLVDPVTTITTEVALPAGYQRLSLVSSAAAGAQAAPAGGDVALLWNAGGASAGVAFWELGQAAGKPFRSIETVGIDANVDGVADVPAPNDTLKVLSTVAGSAFYVLDLGDRTATPLLTSRLNVDVVVSPTGRRVWAFVPGESALASTSLDTKHVTTLRVDGQCDAVFEIGRAAGGGRALIALQTTNGVGATVFDAEAPEGSNRRIYGALLTEGPYDDQ
jgi:hypothetical protein